MNISHIERSSSSSKLAAYKTMSQDTTEETFEYMMDLFYKEEKNDNNSLYNNYNSNAVLSKDVNDKIYNAQQLKLELAQLKITDYEAYLEKMKDIEMSSAKSIGRLAKIAKKYGSQNTGTAEYNGVTMVFDFEKSTISIGDMSSGRIISTGKLSCGFSLNINRNEVGNIGKILSLFSPEDVNKIMEAIITDNIACQAQMEITDKDNKVVNGWGK